MLITLSSREDDKPKYAEIVPFRAGSGYSLSAKLKNLAKSLYKTKIFL